jgi:hypothetical protein
MALDISAARFRIQASVDGGGDIDRLKAQVSGLRGAVDGVASSFSGVRTAFAAISGLAGVAAFAGLARQSINLADALDEARGRIGITGEALSELDYAAKLNGTSLERVETALVRLSSKATDAATGNKSAAATFQALGVSVSGLDGNLKSSDALLQDVADVLSRVEDRTLRTALAVEVFGKSGAELLPFLENMRSSREEARQLGVVIGEDFQKAAAEFNDNLDRSKFLLNSFGTDIASNVLPAFNKLLTEMQAGREIFGSFGSALLNIGTTNPFNSAAENAQKYRDKLAKLQDQLKSFEGSSNRAAGTIRLSIREEIAETEKLVAYFQRMNGQTSTAGAGRGFVNPAAGAGGGASMLQRLRDANADGDKSGSKVSEFEQLKRGLQDQLLKTQDLGRAEELLQQIQSGRYKTLTADQKQELIELARKIDYQKVIGDFEDASAERAEKIARERQQNAEREAREQENAIERWKDIANPAAKYLEQLEQISALVQSGKLTPQEGSSARDSVADQILKIEGLGKKGNDVFKELGEAAKGFANDSADAFVDFTFGAKANFGDLVSSILRDLAKLAIQKSITDPFAKFLDGGGGSSIFSAIGSFLGFAKGGAFGQSGVTPFAKGGMVGSPTLFKFADGGSFRTGVMGEAGPEAILPLGRDGMGRLGVRSQGGSGGTVVNNYVTVNAQTGQTETQGSGDSSLRNLGERVAAAARQVIVEEQRPGGLLYGA